ncbi:nucleotide-binding protein [Roseateles sp. P5_E1]
MSATRPPRLFVGSSVESLDIAYAIQENLDYDAECTVWTQGIFQPTRQALGQLVSAMQRMDFAVFVFSPDDIVKIRGTAHRAVRDNVLFELGLFMGHLSPERCFMVRPRDATDLHLPSDLLGLMSLDFNAERSDKNLLAALGAPCNQIRRAISSSARHASRTASTPTESARQKMERLIGLWDQAPIADYRATLRAGIPFSVVEDEDGAATEALNHVFAFLNAVADTVLQTPDTESLARPVFESAAKSVWGRTFTYFSSHNSPADEFWADRLPPVALLAQRWSKP